MTKDEVLAQAIRNRMRDLEVHRLRIAGAIDELANVLDHLEGRSVVAGQPPAGSSGSPEQPAISSPSSDPVPAGAGAGGGAGSAEEGCTPGTDGGAA